MFKEKGLLWIVDRSSFFGPFCVQAFYFLTNICFYTKMN